MRKRLLSTLLAFCMTMALLPGTARAAGGGSYQVKLDGTFDYDSAYAILESLNSYRRSQGLSELVMDEDMLDAAMQRAAEIAVYYSHDRPDGSSCFTIFPSKFEYGYKRENIAVGQTSANEVMTGWKNSPGHNENMLAEDNSSAGIGSFVDNDGLRYWVQIFVSNPGTPESSRTTGSRAVAATVSVSAANLNLSASPSAASLQVGESAALTVRNANAGCNFSTPDLYLTYAESQALEIASVSIRNDGKAVVSAVGDGETSVKLGVGSGGNVKTIDVPVTIKASAPVRRLTEDMFTVDTDDETYDGKAKTKRITGKDGGLSLIEERDYTVTYSDNTKAGTASITIKGKDSYSGTLIYNFTIEKAERTLSAAMNPARLYIGGPTGTLSLTDNATSELHSYTYSSSDPSVATVSGGTITPVGAGTTTITIFAPATDNYDDGYVMVDLTVSKTSDYTIAATPSPAVGGSVTGGGAYAEGKSVTLTASAASGYRFVGWMENGRQVSTGATYTFTAAGDRTLSAQFERIGTSTPSGTPVRPVSVSPTNDKLEVDSWPQSPAAYKIDDYNYFKLRDIAALLNGTGKQFSVGYDASTGDVTLTSGQSYSVTAGDLTVPPAESRQAAASTNVIYINGVRMQLTAYLIDGYNYFKLRDLASALDFYVGWTAGRGMFLESGKPYSE